MTESMKAAGAGDWPSTERRKPGWAADWQSTVEREKATMAQSLHDNTGGLLVAAMMDITSAEKLLPEEATVVRERLLRARGALDDAIDLNRRMIEDLRPTLLDNFGLLPALTWHFAQVCKSSNIICEHDLPQPSPNFLPAAAIALYRIAQTMLAVMVTHEARAITMTLSVDSEGVKFILSGNDVSECFAREDAATADALASVTGRIKSLGGDMKFETGPGVAVITCRLASDRALEG